MKYAYIIINLIIIALTILMVRQYAPALINDIQMRHDTLYAEKDYYRIRSGSCQKYIVASICSFNVGHTIDHTLNRKFDYLILGNASGGKARLLKTKADKLTINIGRAYLKERVFALLAGVLAALFLLLIFGIGIYLSFKRGRKVRDTAYTQKFLRKLARKVPVPDNPVAVWKSILTEPSMSWVVFRDGTLVICEDKRYPLEHTAWATLDHVIHQPPGPHQGEYSIYLNTEHAVWIISYPGIPVYNYIKLSDSLLEGVAGMMAREARTRDAYGKQILYIERGYAV